MKSIWTHIFKVISFRFCLTTGRNPYETSQGRIKCLQNLPAVSNISYIYRVNPTDWWRWSRTASLWCSPVHCCMQPRDFQLPSLAPFLSSRSFGNACPLILWTENHDQQCRIHLQHLLSFIATYSHKVNLITPEQQTSPKTLTPGSFIQEGSNVEMKKYLHISGFGC